MTDTDDYRTATAPLQNMTFTDFVRWAVLELLNNGETQIEFEIPGMSQDGVKKYMLAFQVRLEEVQ